MSYDEHIECDKALKASEDKATHLQTKLDNIQRELDHILGEKTPTELRIEKIIKRDATVKELESLVQWYKDQLAKKQFEENTNE